MEEAKKCPHCAEKEEEEKVQEEMNMAVLVALVPMLVMTFFSTIGIL